MAASTSKELELLERLDRLTGLMTSSDILVTNAADGPIASNDASSNVPQSSSNPVSDLIVNLTTSANKSPSIVNDRADHVATSLEESLSRLESTWIFPTLQRINHVHEETLKRRRRVDNTMVRPEYDSFLYWRDLTSPIGTFEFDKRAEKEHPFDDSVIAILNDYAVERRQPDDATKSDDVLASLERRIQLLEKLLASSALQKPVTKTQEVTGKSLPPTPVAVNVEPQVHVSVQNQYQPTFYQTQITQNIIIPSTGAQSSQESAVHSTLAETNGHLERVKTKKIGPVVYYAVGDAWMTKEYYEQEMIRRDEEKRKQDERERHAASFDETKVVLVHHPPPSTSVSSLTGESRCKQPYPQPETILIPPQQRLQTTNESRMTSSPHSEVSRKFTFEDPIYKFTLDSPSNADQPHPTQRVVLPHPSTSKSKPVVQQNHSRNNDTTIEPQISTDIEKGERIKGSATTLVPERSLASLLGEDSHAPIKPKGSGFNIKEYVSSYFPMQDQDDMEESKQVSMWVRWAQIANFIRAIVTAGLSLNSAIRNLKDPRIIGIGAQGLMIATIFFTCVDILVSFTVAFPRTFWICWDVEGWDPYRRIWSVWALIADHELLLSVIPLLANVILKVYTFRLGEVLDASSENMALNLNSKTTVELILFGLGLVFTIFLYGFRVFYATAIKKRSPGLGIMVVIKSLLLLYDIVVNAMFLYLVLVYVQKDLFNNPYPVRLMLSVAIPSPIITLATNVLVNVPLHYMFLNMQIRSLNVNSHPGFWQVARASCRKAFHPLISAALGTYAIYSSVALFILIGLMVGWDPLALIASGNVSPSMFPNSGFFSVQTNANGVLRGPLQSGSNVLLGMVWFNLIVNYLAGVVFAIGYWVWIILEGLLGKERGLLKFLQPRGTTR